PMAPSYMPCGWGGISFNESSHIWVENFKVQGRCQSNVELLNSDNITIRYIEAFRSDKHGLFTGGSFHDLTIECCKFYEQIYGSSASHGVYISGGHWNPDLPPVRNVTIRYVESYYNGRHGIQFNGRMENVVIEHCDLHHNILGGISLIGARNILVQHNRIYKNNKQGIILYTYVDTSYWDPNDQESMAHWLATHWTIENVLIRNNSIYMDHDPWYVDEWVYYKPYYHAAVYMVDTSKMLPPYKNIWIMNNIIYNHSDMVIHIGNPEFLMSVRGISNLFYSENDPECVACAGLYPISDLEASYPDNWNSNLAGCDPMFLNLTPTQMIDRTYEEIDFSGPDYTNFPDDFHLQPASPAWTYNAGAFIEGYSTANTVIDTSKPNGGLLPPDYGAQIIQMLFEEGVKPEIQAWFLDHFNLNLECLSLRKSQDSHDRICFRDESRKQVSFAFLNTGEEPVEVKTCLTSASGGTEYTNLFGVTFDAHHEVKVLNNLTLEDNEILQTLGQDTLVILLVNYSEDS
ncbi:MAG: right-handed parallel beta-helix repeat-containing protein, partial [Planctomycetota bacterium]